MLNIGKLAAGGEGYYLATVASGVEDYYTGSGEAPGYWTGAASAGVGVAGEVDADDLRMAGRRTSRQRGGAGELPVGSEGARVRPGV